MNEWNAEPASVAGQAERISKADKDAAAMANLSAGHAVLRATIEITRAATGKVETYELIGTTSQPDQENPA